MVSTCPKELPGTPSLTRLWDGQRQHLERLGCLASIPHVIKPFSTLPLNRHAEDLHRVCSTLRRVHLCIAAWCSMHLAQDLSKADTHFLAITLRRNPTAEPLRSMYALVDAAVLPLTLFDNKFERMQDSFTHSARNPVREALARDMPQLVKEGLLGGVCWRCTLS